MIAVIRRSTGLLAAASLMLALVPTAVAGTPVDPATLNPVPPAFYACQADGANIICRGTLEDALVGTDNGPICGDRHFFEFTAMRLDAVRFYDANDDLVRRTAHRSLSGYFSLSATGEAPTIDVVGHWNEAVEYAVPGDPESGLETTRGLINLTGGSSAPGFGADLHASGRVLPDGTFYGLNHDFFTPGANEALCAALGA